MQVVVLNEARDSSSAGSEWLPCKVRVKKLIIAIDGPVGSGKSTLARRVAQMMGYVYVDTGAMYRALALKALRRGLSLDAAEDLEALAFGTHIDLRANDDTQQVFLDGDDVTAAIRSTEVSQAASKIAVVPAVRHVLVTEQRRAGHQGGVVMEGRDIGTKVFPHADLKIFLDADPVVREQRRLDQQKIKGPSAQSMAAELRERDQRDRTRATSPLVPAPDAVLIDSTKLSEDQVLEQIDELVQRKLQSVL